MKLAPLAVTVLAFGLMIQLLPPASGETFGPNVRVNADTNLDRNVPSLAVGWDGTIYAAWQDKSSGYWRIMFAHAAGSGGSFTGHVQVSMPATQAAIQQSPDIGYWNETVYVVWQETGMYGDVIRFTSIPMPGGLPNMAKQIASSPLDLYCNSPSMAVGPNGTIFVAYTEEYLRLLLVASYDGGETWTNSTLVAASLGNTRGEQRVAVDAWGKVYVVWRDGKNGMIDRPGGIQVEDDDVYIANSTDGGRIFGPGSMVNSQATGKVQSSPSIAIDALGRVHLAWKDERFEPNEGTDIFYAHSDDGKTFSSNIPVNDTSPVVMSPMRTTHQQPWIQVDPLGQHIYIVWVDDRSTNHNAYLAKSMDGGSTFQPAHEVDPGVGTSANFFMDDVATYNGVRDPGEVAVFDNGDGVFSPGSLDGSPDLVVQAGKANLEKDLVGDYLRYNDVNSNDAWDQNEDIIMNGPSGTAPPIRPSALANWDTTGQSVSLLYFNDAVPMNVGAGAVMAVDGFDTAAGGLSPTDPISGASLEIRYRADSSYTGTGNINWALQGGPNNTWFAPSDTGNLWTNVSLDLYSLGITSVADLADMDVSFANNGAGGVAFDRVGLNVTKGIPGLFDSMDTVVYDGPIPTNIGDVLRNFSAYDRIVFVDVDMNGRYDEGDPLVRTATVVGSGGLLYPGDTVLQRADGPRWRTLFNPFPVNDDVAGNNHFMPRIALNPFGYITAIWQDWRRTNGPDIYASTTPVGQTHGPHMAFYTETDQNRAGPGGDVAYSLWVRNVGGVAAARVNVTNVLPPGLDFVQAFPPADYTVGQQRTWDIGYVSSLGFRNIVVNARVNSTITINTVLRTTSTLNFTDMVFMPRPEMHAWLDFIASDLIPPTITHTPPGDAKTGDTVTFIGQVTDDSGVAVVKLYVKPIGAAYFNAPLEDTSLPGGDFNILYNVGSKAGTLEYYIEAVDIYGNVARSPSGAPGQTHSLKVTGGLDMPTIGVIAGAVIAVGVILAVIFLAVMKKRKHPESAELEDEVPPP